MKNVIPFVIAVVIAVFFVNYLNVSSQVRQQAYKSEVTVANAAEAFLDKVADSGAITAKDYTALLADIAGTGGSFNISITITRLYPVPDPNQAGSFVMEYRPAYGWHSNQGGMPNDYKDPKWAGDGPAPEGVQYLIKADNVALSIQQVDAMDYQRSMVTRLGLGTKLQEWNYAKAVRDTGNSIVGNQADPLD